MTRFSVIGHVWDAYFTETFDNVWMNTQNGTIKIRFEKNVGAENALRTLVDHDGKFLKDMTSELVSVDGIITGYCETPCFDGLAIRII